MTITDHSPTVFSVSELNQAARELLEHSFGLLWVEGEISNLARPRSGHVYFSLKDNKAQIRCALFRNRARLLRVPLEDGARIRVRARVSLYTARGDYQLIVEHAEDAGVGALQRAFEQLRARLGSEGLFATERKQPLPAMPARIGVITSATGAAIRDVLSVVSRRYPLGALRIYPVPVQGTAAPDAIVSALNLASQRQDCDVILLVRGGGSLEDLQAFNEESVARAIVACRIPVVSGVGHEVDVTIADFAADVRAATPSAAAELVCPDMSARATTLSHIQARLSQQIRLRLADRQRHFVTLNRRLARQRPRRQLEMAAQRLDEAELRLSRQLRSHLFMHQQRLVAISDRLTRQKPTHRIQQNRVKTQLLTQQLKRITQRRLDTARQRFAVTAHGLHRISPLQTLKRGYAIARDTQGSILRDTAQTALGDTVTVDLARGRLACQVINREDNATLLDHLEP